MQYKIIKNTIIAALLFFPIQAAAKHSGNEEFKAGYEGKIAFLEYAAGGINAEFDDTSDKIFILNTSVRVLTGTGDWTWDDSKYNLYEARVTPGLKISYLHFYTGLGYQLITIKDDTTYTYGNPSKSQYIYIPIGIKLPMEFSNVTLAPYMEYDVFLKEKYTFQTRSRKAKHGWGLKVGIGVKFHRFEITPYVERWVYSNLGYTDGRPVNNNMEIPSIELGIKLNYIF